MSSQLLRRLVSIRLPRVTFIHVKRPKAEAVVYYRAIRPSFGRGKENFVGEFN